jgi:uncharacterized OsmC-like protein
MQLHILNDNYIRLTVDGTDDLEIHGVPFGPLQMLAASLALCTASVLHDYAAIGQFKLIPFAVDVRSHYADHPYRVGRMQLGLVIGPHVPPSRHQALVRAVDQCTVHRTLTRGTSIETTLEVAGAEQA